MRRVLLTRPEAQSAAFARRLGPGFEALIAPLIEIAHRPGSADPGAARALVFTSVNGVEGWRRRGGPTGLPVWCVGSRTADAARAAGHAVAGDAPTLDALAELMRGAPTGALLHVRGTHVAGDLAAALPDRPVAVEIVYEAEARPLSEAAHRALEAGRIDAIPVFSPRTAARLVAERRAGWRLDATRLIAISAPTAEALAPLAPQRVETAPTPDAEGLIAMLHRDSAGTQGLQPTRQDLA